MTGQVNDTPPKWQYLGLGCHLGGTQLSIDLILAYYEKLV